MDKQNQVLKKNFVNVFCNMTKVCKDTLTGVNTSYYQGRKDALEEILAFYNSSDRAVSVNSMSLFLQDKIAKLKNEEEEEIKPIFELNDIKYDMFSNTTIPFTNSNGITNNNMNMNNGNITMNYNTMTNNGNYTQQQQQSQSQQQINSFMSVRKKPRQNNQ